MPVVINELAVSAAGGASGSSDMFLSVQTKRAGKIKGEAVSPDHKEEIVVLSWNWGVSATAATTGMSYKIRREYKELTIVKAIDSATTSLLSALATNDEVREAKLTMRKPGSEQIGFFFITLKDARVSSLEHATDTQGNTVEVVRFTFSKVEVEYRPQQSSGGRGASSSFNDEIVASS